MPAIPALAPQHASIMDEFRAWNESRGVQFSQMLRLAAETFLKRFPEVVSWGTLSTEEQLELYGPQRYHVREKFGYERGRLSCSRVFLLFLFETGYLKPTYDFLFAANMSQLLTRYSTLISPGWFDRLERCWTELGYRGHLKGRDSNGSGFLKNLCFLLLVTGKKIEEILQEDIDGLYQAARESPFLDSAKTTRATEITYIKRVHKMLYHLGILHTLPRQGRPPMTIEEYCQQVTQPRMRESLIRYLNVYRASHEWRTLGHTRSALVLFVRMLEEFPEVTGFEQVTRAHIERWLTYITEYRTRSGRPLSASTRKSLVIEVKVFLESIAEWGWEEAPQGPLIFRRDIPKLEQPLPRYIQNKATEERLMEAVYQHEDPYLTTGLIILYETGIRLNELLNLKLDCIHSYTVDGQEKVFLKVPLGKMRTERMVPLHPDAVAAIDELVAVRGKCRPLPDPRDGNRPAEFLFVKYGKRISKAYIPNGLKRLIKELDLLDQNGNLEPITPHQFRHTRATWLINHGMDVWSLMAFLGHTSPEMSLRYAKLFDRTVYEQVAQTWVRTIRSRLTGEITELSKVDAKTLDLLHGSWVTTRLANGICKRHPREGPCDYSLICERCPRFMPTIADIPTLTRQAIDTMKLLRKYEAKDLPAEAARQRSFLECLEGHLRSLGAPVPNYETAIRGRLSSPKLNTVHLPAQRRMRQVNSGVSMPM